MLKALIVIIWKGSDGSLAREYLVFAKVASSESFFEAGEVGLEGSDPFECIIIEFIMFLHTF